MFLDRARVPIQAGDGGNGVISFRREAHVPRGGPDGGDGGRGGDVILRVDDQLASLGDYRNQRVQAATSGGAGGGSNKSGRAGGDLILRVPPGTTVKDVATGEIVADLVSPGHEIVVARGGKGGRGNARFASSTRRVPRIAEDGQPGERRDLELELRLIADVGLAGLPNAGKSSLLAALTRARPKVAGYPFTTVEPVLGTLERDDRQLVLADIPGLIEGASAGAGLGHEFLAHVERCRLLVHLVDVAGEDPAGAYAAVRSELDEYGTGLDLVPELVVLSKRDLLSDAVAEEAVAEWSDKLAGSALGVLAVSSATGGGIDELERSIFDALPVEAPAPAGSEVAPVDPEFEAEHVVYRPAGEQGFDVQRIGDGVFQVRGRGIELLVGRHDTENPEALAYLEQRLKEIGVIAALRARGFEAGDEVRIGEEAFELHPGE